MGSGDRAVKIGEETVLFRHDKKFVNPCALAVEIKDTLSEGEITKKIEEVLASEIDRVGQKLRVDAIALTNASGDKGKFESAAKLIASKAPNVPIILSTTDPASAEAAVKPFAGKKPIIYGANSGNAEAMANIAKTEKATLGVVANGLDELSTLTEKIKSLGVEDMVIDSGAKRQKKYLNTIP